MTVSAAMVKNLREKTGAGMMDCKKALSETNGDMEGAVDWLRKKGLSAAAKKAGRVAAEGKVMAATTDKRGILVEVNSETDFAAKNEKFVQFAQTVADLILRNQPADLEGLKGQAYPESGRTVEEELTHQISTIGENMNLRRFVDLNVGEGVVAPYIHMGGKIGVLVSLASAVADRSALEDLGKKVAMHVAAANPLYLDRQSVPPEALERERAILVEQARSSGKPDNIIEKMVQGRIEKFYSEVCLVDQPFVLDQENSVGKSVAAAAKAMGGAVQIAGFARYQLGEGIEKEEKDFAQEVAQQVG